MTEISKLDPAFFEPEGCQCADASLGCPEPCEAGEVLCQQCEDSGCSVKRPEPPSRAFLGEPVCSDPKCPCQGGDLGGYELGGPDNDWSGESGEHVTELCSCGKSAADCAEWPATCVLNTDPEFPDGTLLKVAAEQYTDNYLLVVENVRPSGWSPRMLWHRLRRNTLTVYMRPKERWTYLELAEAYLKAIDMGVVPVAYMRLDLPDLTTPPTEVED